MRVGMHYATATYVYTFTVVALVALRHLQYTVCDCDTVLAFARCSSRLAATVDVGRISR